MCTKEQIQEAKKYLSEQGYGTGSTLTLNTVANLMVEWLDENCTVHDIVADTCPKCKSTDCFHDHYLGTLCNNCGHKF